MLRFNDLLATVLAAPTDGTRSRATVWRQCMDMLAQYDRGPGETGLPEDELDRLVGMLEELRTDVDMTQRLGSVVELGRRLRSPLLVRVLMRDEPPIVVAAMNRANLTDAQWPDIIAEAGPLARSMLRRRNDMGLNARHALAAFGTTDLALIDLSAASSGGKTPAAEPETLSPQSLAAEPVETEPPVADDESQIRRIVNRIERFTSERQARASEPSDGRDYETIATPVEPVEGFAFATDADGVISLVTNAPRAALAGLAIGVPSIDRALGPDGQILGAFRRRAAFRDGRFTIADGPLAGNWLINGQPQFDARTGRFTGYRAAARLSGSMDQAPRVSRPATAAAPADPEQGATSLRQLIHELRTPLSGVMGFAELIESQLLGPVGANYRGMAGNIVSDVRSLVDILDDLDAANRNDGYRPAPTGSGTDMHALLDEALNRYTRDGNGDSRIVVERETDLPPLNVAQSVAERIVMHFVRAVVACSGSQQLGARCIRQDGHVALILNRPEGLKSLSDAELFDSGHEHAAVDPDEPVLGVGFAFRLVRKLAEANHGALRVTPACLELTLPVVSQSIDEQTRLP